MDHFTETTRTSYGQNIGNSFKGILFGFVLIAISIGLIWWNEGRSVERADALSSMSENIVTLQGTNYEMTNDSKAVLIQGEVKALSKLKDEMFGVESDGLALRRTVMMYQWKENKTTRTEEKVGGSTETITEYDYVKEWAFGRNDSSSFKHREGHENPMLDYKTQNYLSDANLGDFYLSKNVVGYISASRAYDGLSTLPKKIGQATNYNSYLYIGKDPSTPLVGDVKISYSYTPTGVYTFAAKQDGKNLSAFRTKNGTSLLFARTGRVDAATIFQEEQDANAMLTWILRGAGLFMMFIGFTLIMGPLATLANVLPFLGSLVGGVTSIVAGVLTILLGSIVIALAWFGARPMLSLALIVVGVGVTVFAMKFKKSDTSDEKRDSHRQNRDEEDVQPPRREAKPDENAQPPKREVNPKEEVKPPQRKRATPPLRRES